ncbi:MAG: hypothetical protein ACXWKQ_19840 [Reyranella sp.]
MSPVSVRVVDSITQLGGQDLGCIAVSGSHGGVSSARYALAACPLLSVFNDAGLEALAPPQAQGLAACTVAHASARIGDAQSTLDDGIINHVNAAAARMGVAAGQRCVDAVFAIRNP